MDIVQKARDTINSCSNMAQLDVACAWLQLAFRQMTVMEANDAARLREVRGHFLRERECSLRKREAMSQPVVEDGEV